MGDGWTTFDSATFNVLGQGFVAANITFRKTAGATMYQAVAVRNGADISVFYNCSFDGYLGILYAHFMSQFYRDCDIYGTLDFIFGDASAVSQNGNMYSRLPMQGQFNVITAHGRIDPNEYTGISIHNCILQFAGDFDDSKFAPTTYLGRPLRMYSRTVYLLSDMEELIDPKGWVEKSGGCESCTVYYAEYGTCITMSNAYVNKNYDPLALMNNSFRVKWSGYHRLDDIDAAQFTVSNFIQGDSWLPKTGVPFTGGFF